MQYPDREQRRYAARPRLLATGPPGLDLDPRACLNLGLDLDLVLVLDLDPNLALRGGLSM